MGLKVVSVFPSNAKKGIPTLSAQILLFDAESGQTRALLDGTLITALRTAATTAVASKYLARPDAETLGVFGAGVQAKSQIEAHCDLRRMRYIQIFDPDIDKAESLAHHVGQMLGPASECMVVKDPSDILLTSDIIITATTSRVPVFDGAGLRPGVHINSIGSYKPHVREVDDETIRRSRIVVDSYEHALKEAGDIVIGLERSIIRKTDIVAELGELVLGRKHVRTAPDEITFFKSVGLAVQDLAVAQKVLEKAEHNGVGLVV
jgi:ornithine cyclodeaminase/alanine dehydrogenase-like protein (mu-crystallin family)